MKKVNADFSERVIVHSQEMPWSPSPMAGVDRRPLDRVGQEVARATSIVRYAPGSHFSPHVHTGGEEFLVLDGVFQDEHGDFPEGSYIRNPPGSSHTPRSDEGCTIFVKLWQFEPADNEHVMIRTHDRSFVPYGDATGVSNIELFDDPLEKVCLFKLEAHAALSLDAIKGLELLVLAGDLTEASDRLTQGSWLRLPVDSQANFVAGDQGARIWTKEGNLQQAEKQIARVTEAQQTAL